jgi:hypothetical protein
MARAGTMKRLLSTIEAAEYLGISKSNFYALGVAGRLLNVGWGRKKNLYDLHDLDSLVNERKKVIHRKFIKDVTGAIFK